MVGERRKCMLADVNARKDAIELIANNVISTCDISATELSDVRSTMYGSTASAIADGVIRSSLTMYFTQLF
jgi:hypothetical protein